MSREPYSSAFERWFEAKEASHMERTAESWLARHSPSYAGRRDAGPQIWLMMGCVLAGFMAASLVADLVMSWFPLSRGAYTAILMSLWLTLAMALGTVLAWRSAMRKAWRIEQARVAPQEQLQ